jgi:hypothetical protein
MKIGHADTLRGSRKVALLSLSINISDTAAAERRMFGNFTHIFRMMPAALTFSMN